MPLRSVCWLLISCAPVFGRHSFGDTDSELSKGDKVARTVIDHDRTVLVEAQRNLPATLERSDAESSLSRAWLSVRRTQVKDPTRGITMADIASFFQENTAVVIDSAPRNAKITITPTGSGVEMITTRDTVNLKIGETFKIHFALSGYRDKDETITVSQRTSFVCSELEPATPSSAKSKCPPK